jgi:hypothetical protein
MSKHPTIEGREITDAFTSGYVREHYMPKEEALKRINAKSAQLDETRARMLEIEQQLGTLRGASETLDELRGELRRRDDLDAFRRAGLADPEGAVDDGLVDLFRYAHGKSLDPEVEVEDPDQAFRSWLTDPEGAATHPALGHHLRREAAPMPKTSAPAPAPAPRPAPTGNAGTVSSDPGRMTPQALREYVRSPAYRSLPRERQAEILAQFEGR